MNTGDALVLAINADPDDGTIRGAFKDWSEEQPKPRPLKRYMVVTPQFSDGGSEIEPPEYGCDCIEVEARTKREAIRIGVKQMLKGPYKMYQWCLDQRLDGCNPFSGVRAHEYPEVEGDEF